MVHEQQKSAAALSEIGEQLANLRRDTLERVRRNPVFARVMEGSDVRDIYIRFLKNVYHYATHSAIVIGMAGARTVRRSTRVAQYLLHHAIEETGHEAWAMSDLKELGVSESEVLASRPSLNCMAMIGMEYYYAGHGNPIALLGWMYTLEALGDDIGHAIATKVGAGMNHKGTYFLSGHGDADHDHIKDITNVVLHDVPREDLDELLNVARNAATFYVGLIDDSLVP
jgi:heme oxygenase